MGSHVSGGRGERDGGHRLHNARGQGEHDLDDHSDRPHGRGIKTHELQVGEAAAKDILRAYDFNVPEGTIASSADHAVEAAEKLGYPLAMKIASPDIIHKSDMGGVKLNLATADAVRDAFDLMMLRIRQRAPKANLHGVYIEQMCGRGRESSWE